VATSQEPKRFRFEQFADAASAQAAFDMAFPTGSPAEAAYQALVDIGAQCKSTGPGKVACRYVEKPNELAGWCWYVALYANSNSGIERASLSLARLGL
jgi:hypothetical protein